MKLKKIASLMLAGIMAISMLTACGDNSDEGEANSQVPATSNVVDYANQTLSAVSKEYMTYKSSASLDAELKKAATDTSKFSAANISTVFQSGDPENDENYNYAMAGKIADDMSGVEAYSNESYTGHGFDVMPANKDSKTIVWVYTVSGALNEKQAVEAAATHFSNWMVGSVLTKTLDNGKYDAKYTAEISALKVTNSSMQVGSAWVVAISTTQKVTKASNTQV